MQTRPPKYSKNSPLEEQCRLLASKSCSFFPFTSSIVCHLSTLARKVAAELRVSPLFIINRVVPHHLRG